ncbi:hypothetical protein BV22DRAFT_968476, partial [Leucogyrophana mollusca]
CAILSSHEIVRVRCDHLEDADLWRNCAWTKYWEKDTWIIPIHRPVVKHWVLCVLRFPSREMHLFDSLANNTEESWCSDVKV